MLGAYDARMCGTRSGRVVDGREAFMAKLMASNTRSAPMPRQSDLARRASTRFVADADLSRQKGSNPKRRWQLRDAMAKARAICRRNPDLKAPRRSRGVHRASHLHAWRKPGYWTQRSANCTWRKPTNGSPRQRAGGGARHDRRGGDGDGFLHDVDRRIAKRASCSTKSVTTARRRCASLDSGSVALVVCSSRGP